MYRYIWEEIAETHELTQRDVRAVHSGLGLDLRQRVRHDVLLVQKLVKSFF